jgi:hypothetical protein
MNTERAMAAVAQLWRARAAHRCCRIDCFEDLLHRALLLSAGSKTVHQSGSTTDVTSTKRDLSFTRKLIGKRWRVAHCLFDAVWKQQNIHARRPSSFSHGANPPQRAGKTLAARCNVAGVLVQTWETHAYARAPPHEPRQLLCALWNQYSIGQKRGLQFKRKSAIEHLEYPWHEQRFAAAQCHARASANELPDVGDNAKYLPLLEFMVARAATTRMAERAVEIARASELQQKARCTTRLFALGHIANLN